MVTDGRTRGWSPEDTERLVGAHRLALVRLAVLLRDDVKAAEGAVRGAIADFRRRSRSLSDPDDALDYLRGQVVRGSRTRSSPAAPASRATDAVTGRAQLSPDRRRVLDALDSLPTRQRELVVLCWWADLTVLAAADLVGIGAGAAGTALERGGAAGSADEVRDALTARAELVRSEDLSPEGLPDPSRPPRLPWVLGLASLGVAAALVVPSMLAETDPGPGPDRSETPDPGRLEGALKVDFDGDGNDDVASVDFDPVIRAYQLVISLARGPDLTFSGLAASRPTLIGGVDLDGDYSEEVALNVGDDTAAMPEFFRYVGRNIRRLTPPPTSSTVNGWRMDSPQNRFALRQGRLYTWIDPQSDAVPQETSLWTWTVVDDVRIEPGPPQDRCLVEGRDFPVECVFLPKVNREEARVDVDGDGTGDLVSLEYLVALDEVEVPGFDLSVALSSGGTVSADGPAGAVPQLLRTRSGASAQGPGPGEPVEVSQADQVLRFGLVAGELVALDGAGPG